MYEESGAKEVKNPTYGEAHYYEMSKTIAQWYAEGEEAEALRISRY